VEIGFAVQQAELAGSSRQEYSKSLVFKTNVDANARDADGITLGTVGVQNGLVVRLLNGADGIKNRARNATAPVIPGTVNTRNILVDAVGPGVQSYGFKNLPAGTIRAGQRITVEVKFDEPVTVTGRPTIPFSIGGMPYDLAYAGGSGTKTLSFAYRTKFDVDPRDVAFRQGLGEVIHLPGTKSFIRDRRGNETNYVRDQSGDVIKEDGNRVVVLGAHYQFLREVGIDELNNVLNVESRTFVNESTPPASYVPPTYVQAKYDVNLYKVTYNTVIPELGGRPTTATGLVAIPIPDASEAATPGPVSRPMVSYQHGTVYGLHEVPSYSFSLDKNSQAYRDAYETRLSVAQFAGQGYVVIAADYFGMGDSTEPDAYAVKGSEQQACLDMLRQSSGLIRTENVNATDLLLSGWSQGGLVTMAYLQKLEQEGIKVTGASTASAPSDVLAATSAMLFNRRDSSDPTPNAGWLNTIFVIAAFAYENYYSKPGLAFNFFNPQYYEACKRIYTRDYDHLNFDQSNEDLLVYLTKSDPAPLRVPADLTKLIRPEYFTPNEGVRSDPQYYPFSEFAKLLKDASAYQWVIQSPVQLNYGVNDEAFSPEVALIAYNHQNAINKNNPIEAVPVAAGNHRGTYLTAVNNQRYWFNVLLGRDPGPKPDDLPAA
jgi:pimeloyl-ACP methyl ester carboxylesterase